MLVFKNNVQFLFYFCLFFTSLDLCRADEINIIFALQKLAPASSPELKAYPVLIPEGRSPERLFSSAAQPRILSTFVAPEDAKSIDGKKQFFAYAESRHLLQAIIWNGKSFDFLADPNYTGIGPSHLEKVKSENCIKCHQSGGPIFPQDTWREMNESDPNFGDKKRIDKMKSAQKGKTVYLGVPLKNVNGHPIVRNVQAANRLAQAYRVCETACGKDNDCRYGILATAFRNPGPSQHINRELLGELFETIERPKIAEAQYIKNWPKDEFAYPSSSLRDIPGNFVDDSVSYAELLKMAKSKNIQEGDSSPLGQQLLQLDPTTPRKLVDKINVTEAAPYLRDVAFECLGFTDEDSRILKTFTKQQIEHALADKKMKAFSSDWPPNPKIVMSTFLSLMGKSATEACLCSLDSTKPSKNTPIVKTQAGDVKDIKNAILNSDLELRRPIGREHFERFCSECHSDGGQYYEGSLAPEFPLKDDKSFGNFLKEHRRSLLKQLKQNMPPNESKSKISDSLRKAMFQYVENYK